MGGGGVLSKSFFHLQYSFFFKPDVIISKKYQSVDVYKSVAYLKKVWILFGNLLNMKN